MAFNFGVGLGGFAQGLQQGIKTGSMLNDLINQDAVQTSTKNALKDAQKAHDDAVTQAANANLAKTMGLGPSGPQGPITSAGANAAAPSTPAAATDGVTTQPVDMSMPQATPIPPGNAPTPASPTPAPTSQVSPATMSGTPMAGSGSMAPAPSPAQAVDAARSLDSQPQAAAPQPQAAPQPTDPTAAAQAQPTPSPAASAGLPASTSPTTQAQAQELAEKGAPSVMEFFQKQGVPKIAQTYLAQGDPQKAQAWLDWADQAENKAHMATWAKAWRAVQLGDVQGAGDNILKLYNGYDDGVTASNPQTVKDKDGNITGFNVSLTSQSTGETRSTFVDKNTLMNAGLASLAPPQMFQAIWQKQQAQDAATAAAQKMVAQTKLDTAKELTVEKARANDAQDLAVAKGNITANNQQNKTANEIGAKVQYLQNAGYSQDFINKALPDILGINQNKKSTSPEEAKRLAFSDRMKSDPTFAYKPADQQRQIIDGDMATIYGGIKPGSGSAGAAPGTNTAPNPFQQGTAPVAYTQPNPATAGLAAPAAAPASTPAGRPFLDKTTGKIVYLP